MHHYNSTQHCHRDSFLNIPPSSEWQNDTGPVSLSMPKDNTSNTGLVVTLQIVPTETLFKIFFVRKEIVSCMPQTTMTWHHKLWNDA